MGIIMNKEIIKKAMSLLNEANETALVSKLKSKIERVEKIESLMKDYSLSEEEIDEVLNRFERFNGSLDLYDVEDWNAVQRTLLIDLFEKSYAELYYDDTYGDELLDYNTLSERVMDDPAKYLDYCEWEEVIQEHFDTADIKEIISTYGCCEEDKDSVKQA